MLCCLMIVLSARVKRKKSENRTLWNTHDQLVYERRTDWNQTKMDEANTVNLIPITNSNNPQQEIVSNCMKCTTEM